MKGKVKCFVVIGGLVIIILWIGYSWIFTTSRSNLVLGAFLENDEIDRETYNMKGLIDDEKYFRPSKDTILNINDTNELINDNENKKVEDIIVPNKYFITPEESAINYFSLLREAANWVNDKKAGCGSIGTARTPYKIAYNYFTDEFKKKNSYKSYEDSFANILHINLIKLKEVPTDTEHQGKIRYFYEIETIQGSESGVGYFAYYYGYLYLTKVGQNYLISEVTITPEVYLCAPYHGWNYIAEYVVQIKYGDWCKLLKEIKNTEKDGYIKNVYFNGTDGKEYKIEFFTITNDYDIEIAQYIKDEDGDWDLIRLNPENCLK